MDSSLLCERFTKSVPLPVAPEGELLLEGPLLLEELTLTATTLTSSLDFPLTFAGASSRNTILLPVVTNLACLESDGSSSCEFPEVREFP